MSWPNYFQPEVETVRQDTAEQLARLRAQLSRVYEGSSFYRERFQEVGFHPGQLANLDDLRHVPLLTKQTLRESQEAAAPLGLHAVLDMSKVVRLHVTSGTTGRPVFIGLTEKDSQINSLVGARAFWAAGFRPDDLVLHCLNYAFYAGGMADHLSIERTGATVVPVGVRQSQRLLELAPDLKPTGMFAITSYPFHLAEVAQKVGTDPKGVGFRRLVVGGEPGGSLPETQGQLREIWGAEVSDTYGLSEVVATMGGQCEVHDGIHFVAEDVVHAELIDPASEEPIPIENGAEGELVFTHLIKEATPLVRYRSGDMAHIVAAQCACGRVGFKFRVVGRADDMFIVRGVNVFPSSVEAIVREHTSLVTGEYAILLDSPSPKPPVPIMVEGRKGLSPRQQQDLASSLEETIVRRLQFTARVVVVPAGALQVSEQKTRRIFKLYAGQEPPVRVDT